jgi:hypothetical protein
MPLLVDDLKGTVHRAYGEMPNMVYIIDKQGKVVYKAMWTDHAEIETVVRLARSVHDFASRTGDHSRRLRQPLDFRAGQIAEYVDRGQVVGF